MRRKTKQNALLIFIASLPLIGSIYYTNNIRQNQVDAVDTPKITLNSSNTPAGVEATIVWSDPTTNQPRISFEQEVHYTNFHYKYITKDATSHIILSNQSNPAGYVQNQEPLNYNITSYMIRYSVLAPSWSEIELKTSDIYSSTMEGYVSKTTHTLANAKSKTYTITLNEPYFSLSLKDGGSVKLEFLEIYYSC